ncbi:MAG TPA: 3-phosphoshikimate 1-carboxyvinyltransferase [Candidatus Bilamarchaeum sp.]|nr:3-phosphoshikimate 1-carboxyvinyltransferase [Candidatus Bilamarchaeum sp.]
MKFVKPSRISGKIDAPPSKSMMQRAVIAAALADGESRIANPSFCDDALAAMNVVEALGASVEKGKSDVRITGGGKPQRSVLDCGESGTCMRMISAVAALYDREFTVTGRGSLMNRPVGMIDGPLKELGAECSTNKGMPPLNIMGPMRGGSAKVDGSLSSQFLSGLLMALPLCREDSELKVAGLRSRAYVSMTLSLMGGFGIRAQADERMEKFSVHGGQKYRAQKYEVEGDWSGAAFILVAGAIAGEAEVERLGKGLQPDEGIKTALLLAGAGLETGIDAAKASGGKLKAFEFDAGDCPDLFPPLAVLACCCEGKSVLRGALRLRHKESDRAAVLARELGKIGADINVSGDRMEIEGRRLRGGKIDPHGDHRIAMAGAIAGLVSEKGVEIEDESCVSKSYPGFFRDLESLVMG